MVLFKSATSLFTVFSSLPGFSSLLLFFFSLNTVHKVVFSVCLIIPILHILLGLFLWSAVSLVLLMEVGIIF